MSWASGTLPSGKEAGYAVPCTCEHESCHASINAGLAYACGNSHGEDEVSCEGYFCEEHLHYVELKDGRTVALCATCITWAERQQLVAEEETDEEVEE